MGRRVLRREDPRLLRGLGRYVGDIAPPGTLHAAFVRSIHAHARIRDMDLDKARRMPGVRAVFGVEAGLPALPLLFPHPRLDPVTQRPLPDVVHHVGEPVALILADSRYQAEDAAEVVGISWQPEAAVVNPREALRPDAPRVHHDKDTNLAASFVQNTGDAEAVFLEAPVIVACRLDIRRVSCMPMEARGLLAMWEEQGGDDSLTVIAATQTPHMMRRLYAELLGLPEHRVRVMAPDVGGGFGAKEPFYVEDFLIAWAARNVGRPVRWIEDRMEHLQSAVHEREQQHQARMALTRDGQILALDDRLVTTTGAYVPWGIIVPIITSTLIPGPYKVPHYHCAVSVAYTNTAPLAPYRGAGRPQAALVSNRLLDLAARELHLDPAQIRQRNFIQPEEFPYDTGLTSREGTAMTLDSGNYPGLLNLALNTAGYTEWKHTQTVERARGRLIGLGMALGIENTGMGPHEGARVTVEPDGSVVVSTGAASQGQAHETTLAQVAADLLGVCPSQVRVREGDTAAIAYGTGTFASRTAVVAGSAVQLASLKVREKAVRLAAHVLEAAEEDLAFEGGSIYVRGAPSHAVSLASLAFLASGPHPGSTFSWPIEPGLSAEAYFTPQGAAYSASAHVAVVEVDPETRGVRLLAYTAAHDCGTLINPLVVEGQVLGGVVAGIGTGLFEELHYTPEGQLVTSTLMDYLIPGPVELPEILLSHQETPSPLNPLGAKGAGEGGTIPAPAALLAAIEDAWQGGQGIPPTLERVPVRPGYLFERGSIRDGGRDAKAGSGR